MPKYTLSAEVEVDVQITVEADTEDEAFEMFGKNIEMTADLPGVAADKFNITKTTVSGMDIWETPTSPGRS